MKCNSCKKFGHFEKCCNDITRSKARDTKELKAKVDDDDDLVQNLGLVQLFTDRREEKKEEKKTRQRRAEEKKIKSEDKVDVENDKKVEEGT